MNAAAPLGIELHAEGLQIEWREGPVHLPAGALRAACRCGACRALAVRQGPPANGAPVQLRGVAPVGRYAVQLSFSDGHDRGIYPWSLLHALSGAAGTGHLAGPPIGVLEGTGDC